MTTTLYRECASSHMPNKENVVNVTKWNPVHLHSASSVLRSPLESGSAIVNGKATRKSDTAMFKMRVSSARMG